LSTRVLLVDDDPAMCEMLESRLSRRGYHVEWRTSGDEALASLASGDFDVVVTDLNMPRFGGIELCERVVATRPDVPVIVLTAFGSFETAVAAIRAGAYDFITKPVEVEPLGLAIDRAAQHRALGEEVKRLRQEVADTKHFDELIGESPAMAKVYDLLSRIADSDASVLITGESGTGKEIAARALHRRGARSAGPFVAINCAAMPEQLLESELFGHVRGAFTDARSTRTGLFAQASGGTIFLDEIGDMPLSLQPKLLRALQDRTIRPVGSNQESAIDVRFLAATNKDLEGEVEDKRFREDLYFRINVVRVELPPLRARGNDVLLLAQHFLNRAVRRTGKRILGLSSPAASKLLAYSWPGNVRELENCIERAVALARFEEIGVDDLPERVADFRSTHVALVGTELTELVSMDELERRYILRVLEAAAGNKAVAARILGFDRRTLYRKLHRFGVETKDETGG